MGRILELTETEFMATMTLKKTSHRGDFRVSLRVGVLFSEPYGWTDIGGSAG